MPFLIKSSDEKLLLRRTGFNIRSTYTITNLTTAVIVNNIKTTKKIIVDLDVYNCQIRAFKPEIQVPLRNSDLEQMLFWKGAPSDRLNKRVMGTLRGAALRKAKRLINRNGSLNLSGIYGSLEIDERDFISN
jgi:hypothetical protein